MAQAVRFNSYGGPEVLELISFEVPTPGPHEVLVEVVAAGVNPVESAIREGAHSDKWPVHFPEGQGRDLAGIVRAVGSEVTGFKNGDEVMGYVVRGSHATHVLVPADQLMKKPVNVTWEVAGSLYVAGTTAWTAVQQVQLKPGETVIITAAAGGIGALAAQLAIRAGARVIGTAHPNRDDYLRQLGVIPVGYDEDLITRARELAPRGVAAILDFYGSGVSDLAEALAVPANRVVTTMDWDAVDQHGVAKALAGDLGILREVTTLVADKQIRLPIADIFPFVEIQDAYRKMAKREAPGKIVLSMQPVVSKGDKWWQPDIRQQEVTVDVDTSHEQMKVSEGLPYVVASPKKS